MIVSKVERYLICLINCFPSCFHPLPAGEEEYIQSEGKLLIKPATEVDLGISLTFLNFYVFCMGMRYHFLLSVF